MTKTSPQGAGPGRAVAEETITGGGSRHRQAVYGALCVVGAALPLSQFVPWLAENGLDLPLLFEELFANRISSFFAWDVLISAAVVLAFLALDGGGLPWAQRALAAVATCSVGVSFGLPVYLLLRERHSQRASK
ncbi:MAG: DUF2834 domain-containing protein [Actinobacteria bacterium]|nr:DUF2834 domain-containing protein [Actinomycetota bacterium]